MKVIIIGGGFGGLNAAKALKKTPVDILLLDKANHHLFQPLLYQVATAALSPGNISTSIREALAKQKNASVLLADIVSINKDKKEVIAGNGEAFPYDYLILAPGATHSYFGHTAWESLAPGLKTLSDALKIRERIILSYERAERCTSEYDITKFMRFVIVGAGPTGVELAGAIAELTHKSLAGNFRKIKLEETKIYLIEGMDQVLPSFPKTLADKAKKDLEKLGVDVFLNTHVTNITSDGVWIDDTFIETSNVFWAAGNQASPLLQSLDVPLDKAKRVIVNPDLSIPDYPEIFVIGDAACNYTKEGIPLPGVAQVAIQQGRYVANLIKKNVPINNRKPFEYFDKGTMATIGEAKAVAVVGKVQLSGFTAWLAWCFVHIVYLISYSNRLLVMIQWLWLYCLHQRRLRLITHPIKESENPIHKTK